MADFRDFRDAATRARLEVRMRSGDRRVEGYVGSAPEAAEGVVGGQ